MIPSTYGHDGFLLEYDAISGIVLDFLQSENLSSNHPQFISLNKESVS